VPDFPIGTLMLPEPARTAAWQRWRAELDLDTLSYETLQTLPALAPWLPRWLEGDPYAARMQGIVKMAWTNNQIRVRNAFELRRSLLQTSIGPVVFAGPLAWSLEVREEGAIRTIPDLTVLIRREHIFHALAVLSSNDWQLHGPQPDADTLNWSSNCALTKGDETLHLHWRLSDRCGRDAMGFERAFLERLRTTRWKGTELQVLSPEAELLHRLTGRPEWDPVPWQADVLMMPLDHINWALFCKLATRYASFFAPADVSGRLIALRQEWQLPIPEIAPAAARFDRFSSKLNQWGGVLWKR
jgi:hypothetical protein